jgi:hypothetical protein
MYKARNILQDDSANNQCTSVGIKRSNIAQERIFNEIRIRARLLLW